MAVALDLLEVEVGIRSYWKGISFLNNIGFQIKHSFICNLQVYF